MAILISIETVVVHNGDSNGDGNGHGHGDIYSRTGCDGDSHDNRAGFNNMTVAVEASVTYTSKRQQR